MRRVIQQKLFLSLVVILLTSCYSIEKMKELPVGTQFKVTPNPIEVHNNKVSITIEGTLPGKYFHKKATLEICPILVYSGGELILPAKILQGEKANTNYQVANFKFGCKYKQDIEFDYKNEMFKSDLYLQFSIIYKGKKTPFFRPKIGTGILAPYEIVSGENK